MKQVIVSTLIRAVRTFAQAALGVYLAGLTVSPSLGDLSNAALLEAAAAAGILALILNLYEGLGGKSIPRG